MSTQADPKCRVCGKGELTIEEISIMTCFDCSQREIEEARGRNVLPFPAEEKERGGEMNGAGFFFAYVVNCEGYRAYHVMRVRLDLESEVAS